jgi:hypothetical protein
MKQHFARSGGRPQAIVPDLSMAVLGEANLPGRATQTLGHTRAVEPGARVRGGSHEVDPCDGTFDCMTRPHDTAPFGSVPYLKRIWLDQPGGTGVREVIWHGTLFEQLDLLAALRHNCGCGFDANAALIAPCAGHAMLANDQRAVNGLLWARRLNRQLLAEEGISAP